MTLCIRPDTLGAATLPDGGECNPGAGSSAASLLELTPALGSGAFPGI